MRFILKGLQRLAGGRRQAHHRKRKRGAKHPEGMPETPVWDPYLGAEAIFSTYPVVALCLPPANFSNRFAVKHTIPNDILHITMLAIDITRALKFVDEPNSSVDVTNEFVTLRQY